jgi:hypothetical protein
MSFRRTQQFPRPIPVDWQLAYSDVSPSAGKSLAGQITGAYVPEDKKIVIEIDAEHSWALDKYLAGVARTLQTSAIQFYALCKRSIVLDCFSAGRGSTID